MQIKMTPAKIMLEKANQINKIKPCLTQIKESIIKFKRTGMLTILKI